MAWRAFLSVGDRGWNWRAHQNRDQEIDAMAEGEEKDGGCGGCIGCVIIFVGMLFSLAVLVLVVKMCWWVVKTMWGLL